MQSPLKLAEVRHEQRRVAALLQTTHLLPRYNSIPLASLHHSNYYKYIKYNYLSNRSWRPLVNNDAKGVINHSDIDTPHISLPNINGIKHLYAKYNGRQYVPLTQYDGRVKDGGVFPAAGSPLTDGGGGETFARRITQKLSANESNDVANFLPKINNGTSDNLDETWRLYNSNGLTNVKVRSFNRIGLLSTPLGTTTTGLRPKAMASTDELSKNQTNRYTWQNSGALKVSAIHDELSKVDDKKNKCELNFRERDKNMYKTSGRHGAKHSIKLPDISKSATNKKAVNAPSFRYTHRQSDEIADLPTSDELKDILGSDGTNTKTKPKVVLVKKPVAKNAGNRSKRDDSKLTSRANKTGSPKDVKPMNESFAGRDACSNTLKSSDEDEQNKLENKHLLDTDKDTESDNDNTDSSDSDLDSEMTLDTNDSNALRVKNTDGSCDPWRDAYVNALAVARSRRQMDLSFLGSQTSRPFAFSYFDHVPYCKCKTCMERTMKNRGRKKKKVSALKSIFGDVNLYDYYKT